MRLLPVPRPLDGGEAEPLLDDGGCDEEAGGDFVVAKAPEPQGFEGTELVEGMERDSLDVFSEGILFGEAGVTDHAGDERGFGEALLLHQQLEGSEAATAGRDLEHAGFLPVGIDDGTDAEALQQRPLGDVLGEFFDRDAGLYVADVGLAQYQLVEGYVP